MESRVVDFEGGQSCMYCDGADLGAEKMVDGTEEWWQSPPLSRGFHYNNVTITISLQQVAHPLLCGKPA